MSELVDTCTARRGLPAICIDARHAKAALDMAANKTDANEVRDYRPRGSLASQAASWGSSMPKADGGDIFKVRPVINREIPITLRKRIGRLTESEVLHTIVDGALGFKGGATSGLSGRRRRG